MDLYTEAIARFVELFEAAKSTDLREPTAMSLATGDPDGRTSCRTVLLKGVDERGFVFYTNYLSRKGHQLIANPYASLLFFWQPLMQQVKVEGDVETVTPDEADAYWASRSRDSQLGAWASEQSQPLASREALEQRLAQHQERFRDAPVPRPQQWSGFRVVPERIEFWTSGAHRLHERVCYEQSGDAWSKVLLNP